MLNHYICNAQNKPVWRELTCLARTHLTPLGQDSIVIVVIIINAAVSGLDGRLQKATKLKGIRNFKASEMGLLPVPIDTWQGFAFIHPGKHRQAQIPSLQPFDVVEQEIPLVSRASALLGFAHCHQGSISRSPCHAGVPH